MANQVSPLAFLRGLGSFNEGELKNVYNLLFLVNVSQQTEDDSLTLCHVGVCNSIFIRHGLTSGTVQEFRGLNNFLMCFHPINELPNEPLPPVVIKGGSGGGGNLAHSMNLRSNSEAEPYFSVTLRHLEKPQIFAVEELTPFLAHKDELILHSSFQSFDHYELFGEDGASIASGALSSGFFIGCYYTPIASL